MTTRVRFRGGRARRHKTSRFKTEGSDKSSRNKEPPVLIINEKEEQQDVEMEYFHQDHLAIGQANNQADCHGKETKPLTL